MKKKKIAGNSQVQYIGNKSRGLFSEINFGLTNSLKTTTKITQFFTQIKFMK